MFDDKNHAHAIATAFGSLGGFAAAPAWWTEASQNAAVQLFALTVLIWQGGGALDWSYSLAAAIIFTIAMRMMSSMQVSAPAPAEAPAASEEDVAAEDAAAPPTEYYHNY